jgi:hypothetical protein
MKVSLLTLVGMPTRMSTTIRMPMAIITIMGRVTAIPERAGTATHTA